MKSLPLSVIALLTVPFYLNAAEDQLVDSRITAVTVFADRAEVTREAELVLDAGQHTLIFTDLPTSTDAGSLQVDGTGGFTLQDVRYETRYLTELPEGHLKELTVELEKLQVAAKALAFDAERIQANRAAVDAVLKRVTTTPKETTETPPLDAVKWTEMLTFYNVQLEKINTATLAVAAKQEANSKEQARVKREINLLNSKARKESKTAKVVVSLAEPGKIAVELKYLVYGPRWTPSYDIRANATAKQVEIAYYGNITQNTGEVWKDAAISLSTAQVQVGGREPELHPWFIKEARPVPMAGGALRESALRDRNITGNMMPMLAGDESSLDYAAFVPAAAMKVAQATVQSGATAVVFDIPNTADIPSDNQPVRVAITTQQFAGAFRYSAVPKLSPHTYLKTKVTNTSDFVFLAGPSNIYLDGSFVGKAPVDMVPPGKEFWTWLGVDQGVSVKRKLLEKKAGEGGFFGGKKTMTFSYEFEIKNDKQDKIELVVWDQLPIPQNDEIEVKLIEPDYDGDTDSFKMNSQKFVEWIYQLQPGTEVNVPYEFRVSYPERMNVRGL